MLPYIDQLQKDNRERSAKAMKQTQKDLLIELVKKERMRLTVALSVWRSRDGYSTYEEMATLNQERDLCNSTLKSLTGGE
tara:strand:- start:273 stop:512 length:240 start_codon:yes stop_codon:yes gene_type:complete